MNSENSIQVVSLTSKQRKLRKLSKDHGYRKHTIRLRRILNNGHYVRYPIDFSAGLQLEGQVNLWRAVIDQHLKDVIEHHLVKRNYYLYYDARAFADDQLTGAGAESELAQLNSDLVYEKFERIDNLCRLLREKGVTL